MQGDKGKKKGYGAFMDLITTTAELTSVCARLAGHPVITVDTEFLRETTYYPLLCVVQIGQPRRGRGGRRARRREST